MVFVYAHPALCVRQMMSTSMACIILNGRHLIRWPSFVTTTVRFLLVVCSGESSEAIFHAAMSARLEVRRTLSPMMK